MRLQSCPIYLSPSSSSRHVRLLCRPILRANSHHQYPLATRLFVHRNDFSTVRPDELTPPSSPPLSDDQVQWLIRVTNHPAPHVGHIRILTLNSPKNRNAISSRLMQQLSLEVALVKAQMQETHEKKKGKKEAGKKGKDSRASESESNALATENMGDEESRASESESNALATENRGDEGNKSPEAGLGKTRVLIVASESDVFCAGADLKERAMMTNLHTKKYLEDLRSLFNTLSTLDIPTISAVAGDAHGGGLELALATSLRVFSSAALVSLPETRLGIIPGAGGTYRLSRIIGQPRAMDLILTGRRMDAQEAYSLGVCQRVVQAPAGLDSRAAVLDESLKLARQICEGGPAAIVAAVKAVKLGKEESERTQYTSLMATKDRVRALEAFLEKRKPVFEGN